MEKLKPCPFCGGDAELLEGPRGIARVKCSICHCQTEDKEPDITHGIPTSRRADAIKTWNRRYNENDINRSR